MKRYAATSMHDDRCECCGVHLPAGSLVVLTVEPKDYQMIMSQQFPTMGEFLSAVNEGMLRHSTTINCSVTCAKESS